jgi:hypothetical protein
MPSHQGDLARHKEPVAQHRRERAWIEQVRGMLTQMARMVIQPQGVGILDVEQRFPSAMAAAMSSE